MGLLEDVDSGLWLIAATLLVLQLVVLLVMPNKIARTLAALFATIAWVYTIRFLLRPAVRAMQFFFDDDRARIGDLGAWSVPRCLAAHLGAAGRCSRAG